MDKSKSLQVKTWDLEGRIVSVESVEKNQIGVAMTCHGYDETESNDGTEVLNFQ